MVFNFRQIRTRPRAFEYPQSLLKMLRFGFHGFHVPLKALRFGSGFGQGGGQGKHFFLQSFAVPPAFLVLDPGKEIHQDRLAPDRKGIRCGEECLKSLSQVFEECRREMT